MAKTISIWLYVLFVVAWQWLVYSYEFPGEWYRSLATGLMSIMFVVAIFGLGMICAAFLKEMRQRVYRTWMFSIELFLYAVGFFVLYQGMFGSRVRIPNEYIEILFLLGAIVGFFLLKKIFFQKFEFLVHTKGGDLFSEMGVKKDSPFFESRLCIKVTLGLIALALLAVWRSTR